MRLERRQRGVIFLALMLVLVIGGSAFAISALSNRQTAASAQQAEVQYQLELAKQALLFYARYNDNYPDNSPNLLPCPDIDYDVDNAGDSDSNCNPSTEYFGRLPRYVQIMDAIGAVELDVGSPYVDPGAYLNDEEYRYAASPNLAGFWYAVSPNFLDTTQGTLAVNSAQNGTLTLDGTGDIVAVIIAPGDSLDQNRILNPDDYAEYLEGGNGVNTDFWNFYEENPDAFNDTVLAITRAEIQDESTYEMVAEKIRIRIDAYYTLCAYYPRSYRSNTCSISFSVTSAGAAFRNWINAAGNPVTWMKETASSGDNWVASTSMVYTYVSTTSATIAFKQYGTTSCIRYSLSASPSTLTRLSDDAC